MNGANLSKWKGDLSTYKIRQRKGIKLKLTISLLLFVVLMTVFNPLNAQPQVDWIQYYGGPLTDDFMDVYRTADGGYVLVGRYNMGMLPDSSGTNTDLWIVRLSRDRQFLWQRQYDIFDCLYHEIGKSIIETDNGDFVIGCNSSRYGEEKFVGMKLNSQGDRIWERRYGGNENGYCNAVIEAKSGTYLFGGRVYQDNIRRGYCVMVDDDGEIIWERNFDPQQLSLIYSIREVPDAGYLLAGVAQSHFAMVFIDDNGDVQWNRVYRTDQHQYSCCTGLISVGQNYALAGYAGGNRREDFRLVLVDNDGQQIWDHVYNIDGFQLCYALAGTVNGGFYLVGENDVNAIYPFIIRTEPSGDLIWARTLREVPYGALYSIILDDDLSPVLAGQGSGGQPPSYQGIIAKLHPEPIAPQITDYNPRNLELTILTGDSISFWVIAEDYQNDSLRYAWFENNNQVSRDTMVTVVFDESGDYSIRAIVSDRTLSDSVQWSVSVRDMFIATTTPDTLNLTLRRGTQVDFSIDSVAMVDEGQADRLTYAWRLFDYTAERWDSVGTDSSASIVFDRTGRFGVEAMAYLDESSDGVLWDVNVRGVIRSSLPENDNLTVTPGSSITFELDPFNPQSDSLMFIWTFDGDELAGNKAQIALDFNVEGRYEVVGYAFEGAEADSQRWVVTVARQEGVNEFRVRSYELRMSIVPNPFNSLTEIQFNIPQVSDVLLRLYDINGREIETLLEEKVKPAGSYTVTLDGKDLPAGLYFARLVAGNEVKIAKVLLIR